VTIYKQKVKNHTYFPDTTAENPASTGFSAYRFEGAVISLFSSCFGLSEVQNDKT
jgi:hypothetical protein